ncbi:hypothetical protein CPB84DRAFT_1850866 [Gymnopilus junonius]|uniref:Uncharacterized protein n=1 Tax=Gymnopilus junonius TaxID=109634 RepID=A0A9P5NFV6_GYMJU|nr:hypothetical protein CPB84DRAFT_1850866 [Gymnopilus junonius]
MSPHASQTSNSSIDLNAPFSIEKFLDLLQRWVVIDDQSIHILECPEFHDLMLYLGAGKIDDKDLPHCHKMMDMIIDAYKSLKDMHSRLSSLAIFTHLFPRICPPTLLATSVCHPTCDPTSSAAPSLGDVTAGSGWWGLLPQLGASGSWGACKEA